ncbi:unnamed protein product [Onchocerca flexuosa]|uniref:Neur_chan_LBD domain-containing protein n=1 Tax=Onchocerca flexuosa TaxID=387005 RepID=A0A183H6A4_9BILA|nr:unnamed protein product [Onchocerca flexuosa]
MLLFFPFLLTSKLVLMARRNFVELEGQLYQDLLYDYNKIPRPIKKKHRSNLGASLIRIIDVDEKNQILTTNLRFEMNDSKLIWDPSKFAGNTTLHIPSNQIWTPDLVLHCKIVDIEKDLEVGKMLPLNLAKNCLQCSRDPDITIYTDAIVTYDGHIKL